MMEMTLEGMLKTFLSQWAKTSLYFGVKVTVIGCPEHEIIINPRANWEAKQEYYQRAYNENLELKANPEIKIVGYAFGNSLVEIQQELGV